MTWVFHFFVFMQIWNMICSRKIRDELNIFSGLATNFLFIIVWLIIVGGQVLISTSGKIFHLHTAGLSLKQHLQAMGLAATVFIVNAILKLFGDGIMPFGLGPDSAYDRMMEAKKTDVGGNDEYAAANDDAEKGTSIN